MLFALHSYLQYRLRRGPFGSRQADGAMAVALAESVPQWVLDDLRPGDAVFTQRLNSGLSWAMMYLTSSSVDHAGVVDEDGQVTHMTLAGVRRHALTTLGRGARVVVFRPDIAGLKDPFAITDGRLYRGRMRLHSVPAKLQLALIGCGIVLGAFPDRFRPKFLADILIAIGLIDLVLIAAGGQAAAWTVAGSLLLITMVNLARAEAGRRRGSLPLVISHPDQVYRACLRYGGVMTSSFGPLAVTGFGIMPLAIFLRLDERLRMRRKGSDDGPDDDLQEAGRLGSRRLEDGDLARFMSEAEHEDQEGVQYQQKDKNAHPERDTGDEVNGPHR